MPAEARVYILEYTEMQRIGPDDSAMLLLAEQITILLLGTCDLRVLRHSDPDYKPQTFSEKSDDLSQDYARHVAHDAPSFDNDVHDDDVNVAVQGLADGDEDDGEAHDADGKTGASKARWRAMKEVAAQIQAIAKQVFAQVDCIPAIDRPTFAGFYKNIEGLNFHSPFSETYSRAVVTKIVVPRVMAIYRRSALLCREKATTKYVGRIGAKSPNRVEFYVHETFGPPHGAKVSMIFEFTEDGKPNPYSWVRLMHVVCQSDAERAKIPGIRIEWQENGQLKTQYLQTSHDPARFNDAIPGGIRAPGETIGLLNSLERKIVTQGRQAFET
ncbi:hypothetical protein LTR78_008006 [Recurvomyces mirabilis]|uniref:Uncharacterized protein n=1 Tax=Recurvomyces mirabilis TaxID=574656 RepID=A0AAE0TQR6_9PEZI|nr:hypothetical protein LTR78_008006 [Recurvomyces mirabilis]KAK5150734.1 hypothetical protein LTS14_009796 [Recurvomyces mirabilis]